VLSGIAGVAAIAIALTGCSSAPQAAQTPVTSSPAFSSAPSTPSSTPTPTPPSTPRTTPKTTAPKTTPKATKPAKPGAINPLTGGAASNNPVVAVKIDNTAGGRPQYGISQADVVYIEQVEGGLTRMMAVFHSHLPTEVGAVRSVRTTDVELLRAYGTPILVFSGGAGGPLAVLAASPVIDASAANGYWRSDAAYAPYDLHADLTKIVASVSGAGPAQSIGFTFAASYKPLAKAPKATSIDVTMQAGYTGFRYDSAKGNYGVLNAGGTAVDATGGNLTASNVLVQNVIDEPDGNYDSIGSPSFLSHTVGAGTFTLFRDGRAIAGTWSRETADDPTTFIDKATGKPVGFKPGNTWVTLAPQTSQVTVG
jgi:hypothetical protein